MFSDTVLRQRAKEQQMDKQMENAAEHTERRVPPFEWPRGESKEILDQMMVQVHAMRVELTGARLELSLVNRQLGVAEGALSAISAMNGDYTQPAAELAIERINQLRDERVTIRTVAGTSGTG